MDKLLFNLAMWGCDVNGTLRRFRNNEALILKFVNRFPEEPAIEGLAKAMAAGDCDAAFREAHTLKGTSGNLGITPVYNALIPHVEALRAKDFQQAQECYPMVQTKLNEFAALIRNQ